MNIRHQRILSEYVSRYEHTDMHVKPKRVKDTWKSYLLYLLTGLAFTGMCLLPMWSDWLRAEMAWGF